MSRGDLPSWWQKGMRYRDRHKGIVEWRFYVKTPAGKKQVSAYGKTITKLKSERTRIEQSYEFAPERITLNELLDRYIADKRADRTIDQRKIGDMESRFKRFVRDKLGRLTIARLCSNWALIGAHFRELSDLKPNSYAVQRAFDELKRAFKFALARQWCTINPVAYLERPEYSPESERQPFTLEQILDLLIKAVGRNRVMIAFLVMTGVRTWSEMSGVRVRDCNFLRKTVRLCTFVRRTEKGRPEEKPEIVGKPRGKTYRAERDVPLIDPLIALLEPYINQAGLRPDDYLFPNKHGGLLRANNWIRDFWKPLVEAIGRQNAVPYELRHTTATLLKALKVDVETRAAICGHSPSVNETVYAKTTIESKREALDKLGELFPSLVAVPVADESPHDNEGAA